jgi:hypothetical protein
MKAMVVLFSAIAGQIHLSGNGSTVQGDRHPISSKRWDYRSLIAHTPKTGGLSGKVSIRNGRDGQRAIPQGLRSLQALLQMPVIIEYRRKEFLPSANPAQFNLSNYQAQIGYIPLYKRKTTVS